MNETIVIIATAAAAVVATVAAAAVVVGVPVLLYKKGWLVRAILGIAATVALGYASLFAYAILDHLRYQAGFHTAAEVEELKREEEDRAWRAAYQAECEAKLSPEALKADPSQCFAIFLERKAEQ